MTETKLCCACGKPEGEVLFDDTRQICRLCRTQKHEIKTSATYGAYLNKLHINSKSANKRGTRTKNHEYEIVLHDLIHLWEKQGGRCAISNVFLTHHKDGSGKKEFNASIDRISNAKGYTLDNVQLVAYRINLMKHALSEDMFYWWIKTINDFSCD